MSSTAPPESRAAEAGAPSCPRNDLGQAVGVSLPDWQPLPPPRGEPLVGRWVQLVRFQPQVHMPSLHAAARADVSGAGWTYLPYGPFATPEAHMAWAQRTTQSEDPLFYAVVDATQRALGHAAFMRIDGAHGVIEIGHVYFAPALQRTRAATEVIALMLKDAFSAGYRRVEWKCNALNEPSRRAAERLGFRYEGTFRQAQVVKGRNRDTAWFAMLDTDWPVVSEALNAWLAPENFDAQGRQRDPLQRLRAQVATSAPAVALQALLTPTDNGYSS